MVAMALSETQKNILAHICNNKRNSITIQRIAEDLSIPNAEDEVKSLIQADYLVLMHPREHGKRPLKLTDKGEAVSFTVCGDRVTFDSLTSNHPYLDQAEGIKEFKRIVKKADVRTVVMQKFCSMIVQKGLFDHEGASTFESQGNRWARRDIFIALTKEMVAINSSNPGSIDVKQWLKYVKKIDSSVKLDSLLEPPQGLKLAAPDSTL